VYDGARPSESSAGVEFRGGLVLVAGCLLLLGDTFDVLDLLSCFVTSPKYLVSCFPRSLVPCVFRCFFKICVFPPPLSRGFLPAWFIVLFLLYTLLRPSDKRFA